MTSEADFPFTELFSQDLTPAEEGWPATVLSAIKVCRPDRDLDNQFGIAIKSEAPERKRWVSRLPELTHLRYLLVNRTNQLLFDSICKLPNLERLRIYDTSISNCANVVKLKKLTHLSLGSSPQLESIKPITELASINSLELGGNFQKITHLDEIETLTRLKALVLIGSDSRYQAYDSLEPLRALINLRYVAIISIKLKNPDLKPLGKIKNLEYIMFSKYELKQWPVSDYQYLYENLPNLKGNLIRLAATDKEFQKEYKIR